MGHKTLLANVYNKIPGTIILKFYLAVDFMEILSSSRSNYSYFSIRNDVLGKNAFRILDKCEP